AAVFHFQELDRGRLLLEMWRSAPSGSSGVPLPRTPQLDELDRRIAESEQALAEVSRPPEELLRRHEELLLQHDRPFEALLRDRGRPTGAAVPAIPELAELDQALPPGTVYIAPSWVDDALYLLVVRRGEGGRVVAVSGSATSVRRQLHALRRCLNTQIDLYARGLLAADPGKGQLDRHLEDLGQGPLGEALGQVLADRGEAQRLLWVPDGELYGLPLHALRRAWCGRGERRSYLIEHHEVVQTFGGALFVHQARAPRRRGGRALVVAESPAVLPSAASEGAGVAASFFRRAVVSGPGASRDA